MTNLAVVKPIGHQIFLSVIREGIAKASTEQEREKYLKNVPKFKSQFTNTMICSFLSLGESYLPVKSDSSFQNQEPNISFLMVREYFSFVC